MIGKLGVRKIPCKLPQLVDYMLWYHECSGLSHPWLLSRGDSRIAIENFIHLHTCFQHRDPDGIRVQFTSCFSNGNLQIFGTIMSTPHTLHLRKGREVIEVDFEPPRLEHASPFYHMSKTFQYDKYSEGLLHAVISTHFPHGVIFERAYRVRLYIASPQYHQPEGVPTGISIPQDPSPSEFAQGIAEFPEQLVDLMREQARKRERPRAGLRELSCADVRVQGVPQTDLEREAQSAHPGLWSAHQDILVAKSAVLGEIFGKQQPPPANITVNAVCTENQSPGLVRSQVPSRLDSAYAFSPVDTNKLRVLTSTPASRKRIRHSYDDESDTEGDDYPQRFTRAHPRTRRLSSPYSNSDKENEDYSITSPRHDLSHYREMRDLELKFSHRMNEVLAENQKLRCQIQDLNEITRGKLRNLETVVRKEFTAKESDIHRDPGTVFAEDEAMGQRPSSPRTGGYWLTNYKYGLDPNSRSTPPPLRRTRDPFTDSRERAFVEAMDSSSSYDSVTPLHDQVKFKIRGKGKQKAIDDSKQDSPMKGLTPETQATIPVPNQDEIKRNYAEFLRKAIRKEGGFSTSNSGPSSSDQGYISSDSKGTEEGLMDWEVVAIGTPASLSTAEIPTPSGKTGDRFFCEVADMGVSPPASSNAFD